MKTLIYFLYFNFSLFVTNPPCDSDEFMEKCSPDLGDFLFIRKFDISNKTEYSYVLSRDSEYRIVICDQNESGKKMIVNFYDRNKKLITSNYLKSSKKFYPTISYKCAATGVYYVEASFENDKSGCGVNILGFKK